MVRIVVRVPLQSTARTLDEFEVVARFLEQTTEVLAEEAKQLQAES